MLFESYQFAVVRKRVTNLQWPQNVRRWSTRAVSPKLRSLGRRRAATRIRLRLFIEIHRGERNSRPNRRHSMRLRANAREIYEKHPRYLDLWFFQYVFVSQPFRYPWNLLIFIHCSRIVCFKMAGILSWQYCIDCVPKNRRRFFWKIFSPFFYLLLEKFVVIFVDRRVRCIADFINRES